MDSFNSRSSRGWATVCSAWAIMAKKRCCCGCSSASSGLTAEADANCARDGVTEVAFVVFVPLVNVAGTGIGTMGRAVILDVQRRPRRMRSSESGLTKEPAVNSAASADAMGVALTGVVVAYVPCTRIAWRFEKCELSQTCEVWVLLCVIGSGKRPCVPRNADAYGVERCGCIVVTAAGVAGAARDEALGDAGASLSSSSAMTPASLINKYRKGCRVLSQARSTYSAKKA